MVLPIRYGRGGAARVRVVSYLHVPRLVFSGQFMTDPSTVNNVVQHYDTDAFTPNYWQTGDSNGWWNPGGTGSWRFPHVVVTAAVYSDGSLCRQSQLDPVVGAAIRGTDAAPTAARPVVPSLPPWR